MPLKITDFLQNSKGAQKFKKDIRPAHVFGLGLTFDSETQEIKSVKLIARDKYSLRGFNNLLANQDDKEVSEFFSILSSAEHEDPNDGLHGKLVALKLDAVGNEQIALYRRLGHVPVSYEGGLWYAYSYENFYANYFTNLNFDKSTEALFKIEVKTSLAGEPKGICLYPKYSAMGASMSDTLIDFFRLRMDEIFGERKQIVTVIRHISSRYGMALVSLGEGEGVIKAYFVDFPCRRYLLDDI